MYLITAPFPKTSQSPVPYRRPLGVPYRHPLGVPYNGPPLYLKTFSFKVAEKSPVLLCFGIVAKIRLIALSNPISSIWSASSTIKTSTDFSFCLIGSDLFIKSSNRPGVAMTISGHLVPSSFSRSSSIFVIPPTHVIALKSQNLKQKKNNFFVYKFQLKIFKKNHFLNWSIFTQFRLGS